MTINEMHYEFKLQYDKIDAYDRRNLEPWEIDSFLNRAIFLFLISRYDISKSTKRGFETDQKRISDLSSLHIKSPELQPYITPVLIAPGRYEINVSTLGNNINNSYYRYMFLTKAIVEMEKNNCTKLCEVNLYQIDDRKNTYNEPSWNWCRTLGNFGRSTYPVSTVDVPATSQNNPYYNQNLELITPGAPDLHDLLNDRIQSFYLDTTDTNGVSQYTVNKVYISYIKYPNRVFFGGYDHIDGLVDSSAQQIHCDLNDLVHPEVIRLAVGLARKDLQDQAGIQTSAQLIAQDNNNS